MSSSTASLSSSPIREFYRNKSILVTGSTGFIGKVLIEKLLYSCPEINKIYLLIRSAQGKSPQVRLLDMIEQKPFNIRLKPELIKHKLVAIESDLSQPQLALSQESRATLLEEVSLIFHVAASVKFEAPLEVNMRHNVMATKELLEFACQFKQLACFIHVSTAYSNCQLNQIDERIYKMEVPEDPISLKVTKAMLDNRPNTYTYTKAMAENVANQYGDRINVVIVRPSIVMSAMEEPTEGWVDTINGPVGLSVLGALGILQKIKVNSEVVFDLIPVDIVTNALVSIAWAATERRKEFNETTEALTSSQESVGSGRSRSALAVMDENANCLTTTTKSQNNSQGIRDTITTTTTTTTTKPAPQQANGSTVVANGTSSTNSSTTKSSSSSSNGTNCTKAAPAPATATATVAASESAPEEAVEAKQSIGSSAVGTKAEVANEARVFNLTTGSENPCSFYHYFSIGREEAYKKPSARALRPLLTIPKQKGMNPIQYWIHKMLTHLLFAHIIDLILSLFGQKTMVVRAVNRMHHANEVFDYFCSNQWNFNTNNVKRLRELQTDGDKSEFNCDVRTIDWNHYAKVGWLGCRRFILKEPDETASYARLRYKCICFLYYACKLFLLAASTALASYLIESKLTLSMCMLPIYAVVYLL